MKPLPTILPAIALVLALAGCGGEGDKQPATTGGLPQVTDAENSGDSGIVVEAEDFAAHGGAIETPMRVEEDDGASGGKCIRIPGGSGKPLDVKHDNQDEKYPERWGAVSYNISVGEAGKYRFWGRRFWEDGCGNSLTLAVNGGPKIAFSGPTYGEWQWQKCGTLLDLKAGENLVEVLNREDGVRLDKFILTSDLDFIPQGTE